jgi:DNA polymerase-3 subunit delta'
MHSKRKVYIINDAEKMTVQAQNCLLKTLEEPPHYTVIILTTSNYEGLTGTIRSRAVRYNFRKNTINEVKEFLARKTGGSLENLDFVAAYSGGNIGAALGFAASSEFKLLREKTFEILIRLRESKLLDAFETYVFFEDNKAVVDSILDVMLLYYRDLLVLKLTGKEKILINYDKKDIILSNVSAFGTRKLVDNIELIEKTRRNIKQNANFQLSIEVLLMKLQEELC